jgi:hypothetical protein
MRGNIFNGVEFLEVWNAACMHQYRTLLYSLYLVEYAFRYVTPAQEFDDALPRNVKSFRSKLKFTNANSETFSN